MKNIIFSIIFLIGCNAQESGIVSDLALGNPDNYFVSWDEYAGTGPVTVLMGDSRIDFMPVEEIFPGRHVVNIALGGTSSANTLSRVPYVKQFFPDKIFVSVGINDIVRGWSVGYTERMKSILSLLREQNPAAEIYYTGVVPPVSSHALFTTAVGMNIGIESAGTDSGAIYIGVDGMLDGSGGLRGEYATDGLHYSAAGYDKFAEILESVNF